MKKFFALAIMSAACLFAQTATVQPTAAATAAEKPVWILDETNCEPSLKYSTRQFFGDKIDVKPAEGGGFVLKSPATRFLKLMPEHWLVFELANVESLPGKYHAWSLHAFKPLNSKLAGNVTSIPSGLYTIQMPDVKKDLSLPIRFYNYNMALTFKYIKSEKAPVNCIGVEFPAGKERIEVGDKFKVFLKLAEPCEDVTCKLLSDTGRGPNAFAINGKDNVEMTPIDDDCKIWEANIDVKSLQAGSYGKRAVMIKVSVLGSRFHMPLYTYIPYGFGPAKK